MNQRVLTTICLESISILKHLLSWQKKLFEIKDKKKNNHFVEEIKNRWSKLENEIEKKKMPENKKTIE